MELPDLNFKCVLLSVVVARNNGRNVLHGTEPEQSIHDNLVHLGLTRARDIFGLLSWRLSFSSSSAAPSYVCVLFTSPYLDCRLLCKGHLYNLYKCAYTLHQHLKIASNIFGISGVPAFDIAGSGLACNLSGFLTMKVQVAAVVCKSWKSSVAFIQPVCLSGRTAHW